MRIAAVVALRRMKDPAVAEFLKDADEYIVTEAARAINDDYSIVDALPALAMVLKENRFTGEPLLRRAINANLRVGKAENLALLAEYINRKDAPEAMRAEALAALSGWAKPSVLDRVDGRYRGPITRDAAPAIAAIEPSLNGLLNTPTESVQIAATSAVSKLGIATSANTLFELLKSASSGNVRKAALTALSQIKFPEMANAIEFALADESKSVRSEALGMLAEADLPEESAIKLFTNILQGGTMEEKQATLAALGKLKSAGAIKVIMQQVDQLIAGKAAPAIQLDILEAAEANGATELTNKIAIYQKSKKIDDSLADFTETLAGGNKRKGQNIFYRNEAAQCVRCHAIFEWGGDAGPVLAGIASKRSPMELLESIIEPSAQYSPGYGVATLTLKDGTTTAGIVMEETETEVKLKIGKEALQTIAKSTIENREDVPSSMPGIKDILSKQEIRDLMAFLMSLEEEES